MLTDPDRLFEELSNHGRWGADDQRGTANLIDHAAVLRGVAAVRYGRVVSLARLLEPSRPVTPPAIVSHKMLYIDHSPTGAVDSVEIAPHGFEVTHVDALSHSYRNGMVYNERRAADVVTFRGIEFGDISALAGGLVTRGVLLDVAAARGVEHLEPTDVVRDVDLDAACELARVSPSPGDAVVVRTGIELQGDTNRLSTCQRTGLDLSCIAWLRRQDVSVYAGDCIEAIPSGTTMDMPLHTIGLVSMGLTLVDAPLLEPLVSACHELGRAEFLFVCAPLPIRGASGSAVNPLAIL